MSFDRGIAIIGGGAVGKAFACDCALGGNTDVRLYARHAFSSITHEQVQKYGLTIYGMQKNRCGYRREGTSYPHLISENIGAVMAGASYVVVTTPSSAHQSLFAEMIPHLEDDMVIHIIPNNYGALRLRKMMKDVGCNKRIIVGGWNLPPFGARLAGPEGQQSYQIRMVNRFIDIVGAAFPYSDQEIFMESIRYMAAFDCPRINNGIHHGDTILDADLSNLNCVLHIPTTILGVGVMENWGTIFGSEKKDFSIFCHAMCPTIAKVQHTFYAEEESVAKALGITIRHFPYNSFLNRESVLADTYLAKEDYAGFEDPCPHQLGIGPSSIHHRFVTEDVPMCAHVVHQLGKLTGTPTPLINAFITIAGAMTSSNYFRSGAQLEDFGIAGMSPKELSYYLRHG